MSWSNFHRKLRERVKLGDYPEWLKKHTRLERIVMLCMSTPDWIAPTELHALEEQAKKLTLLTGIKHVVDHIVPVQHPFVCGLTVPWNLRVVPKSVNAAKGNSWFPDQLELIGHEVAQQELRF